MVKASPMSLTSQNNYPLVNRIKGSPSVKLCRKSSLRKWQERPLSTGSQASGTNIKQLCTEALAWTPYSWGWGSPESCPPAKPPCWAGQPTGTALRCFLRDFRHFHFCTGFSFEHMPRDSPLAWKLEAALLLCTPSSANYSLLVQLLRAYKAAFACTCGTEGMQSLSEPSSGVSFV